MRWLFNLLAFNLLSINYPSTFLPHPPRMPLIWFSLSALFIVAFEYVNCIMYIQDFITFNDYCLLLCIVPLLITIATLIQFCYFVSLIRSRLQLLADLLKGHRMPQQHRFIAKFNYRRNVVLVEQKQQQQEVEEAKKKLDIRVIQSLYEKLHEATEILNSFFGLQLVVLVTMLFITLTTLSYYMCMQIIRWLDFIAHQEFIIEIFITQRLSARTATTTSDDLWAVIGTGLWIIMFLIKIFTLCWYCQRVKDQGSACGHYLHHFMLDKQYKMERNEVGGRNYGN